ncbi:barstar family protein [Peribacillus muralis]|uniref:barstar family protein n=1 Tax=Peribacillus muralis TaxID=264697 RepID=UPI001F4EC699|nr:barstar family protein [Peribacillus muralis]MCK1995535.1 barstar family protein [Peribacillus muralis]MCK2015455.1 barstar family protein [Peribacillus muralis]
MEISMFTKLEKPFFHLSDNQVMFKKLYEACCESDSKKFVVMIEGQYCHNKKGLFREFARKLHFPDYFGHNWDAFNECINDLEWLDADQYVLFIKDFHLILENDEENVEIFLSILDYTVKEWKMGRDYGALQTPPTPFHIVIYSDKASISGFDVIKSRWK